MIAPIAQRLVCLGEIGTMHVHYVSEGKTRGTHVTAVLGEFLCLPGDACGCDGSSWWDLMGTIDDDSWKWNGEGSPTDCDGRRVIRIVAYI